MEFSHRSVLLEEVLENLNIREDGTYIDGTLGGAGHASEIIKRLGPEGRLFGFDRDKDALEAAGARLLAYGDRVTLIRSNFSEIGAAFRNRKPGKVDGILLDLGVSSFQLDTPSRGFTYREDDAPLDMRMDDREGLTAADVVNTYSKEQLREVLQTYGEERFALRIAEEIVRRREEKPLRTAGELVEAVKAALPQKALRAKGHPAKQTFQAIRIEVNGELTALKTFLQDAPDLLLPGGRVCIITFHSLEDRMVKQAMRDWEDPCICPKEFPVCVCGRKSRGRVITRKPILPGAAELLENPRSKSAKLRVFEKGSEEQ